MTAPAAADIRLCVSCGYDLRGLDADGACPECGTPVERSQEGDLLTAASVRWLDNLCRGQRLIAVGVTITIAGLMVAVLTALLMPLAGGVAAGVVLVAAGLAQMGGLVMVTLGAFLMTVAEPRQSEDESPYSARRMTRWSIAATVGLLVVWRAITPNPSVLLDTIVFLLVIGSMTAALVMLLAWLEHLAGRTPERMLAARARSQRRFFRVVIPAIAFLGIFAGGRTASVPLPQGVLATVGSVVRLVFGVLFIVLIVYGAFFATLMRDCHAAFRECRNLAYARELGDQYRKECETAGASDNADISRT